MQTYIDALPSGSYVAIAHFYDPEESGPSELPRKMEDRFVHSPMGSGRFRMSKIGSTRPLVSSPPRKGSTRTEFNCSAGGVLE